MTAYIRNLAKSVDQIYGSQFRNILVNGCSYVWNNSLEHVCTWPYYLRDVAGFDQVFDCSQSGAGSDHIFNSTIYEIETNQNISPESTLIIIMWSGLHRHDVIATKDVTEPWHDMSNYHFDDEFATLSIFTNSNGQSALHDLCRQYWKIIDFRSQILASILKVIALKEFLQAKDYQWIFLTWKPLSKELQGSQISVNLQKKLLSLIDNIMTLDEYAVKTNQLIPNDGHPTTEAHLEWVRKYLAPYLSTKNLLVKK